jgi:DtxR family transcriptional regulator, Mn-dependent transcriptional regulator
MSKESLSASVENFVKAVYVLQQKLEQENTDTEIDEIRVATNSLSVALEITAPSVTDMAKRLTESGLVDYRKYYGMRLTETGATLALTLIRRHRLIELYLVNELGYELHEVHNEAEELEHTVSKRFIEAINAKLNNPQFDPHGDPIPDEAGIIAHRELHPLSQLPLTTPAQVSRFVSHDDQMLQHILDRGFQLNAQIEVLARDPYEGPITIQLDGTKIVIGYTLAKSILVEILG